MTTSFQYEDPLLRQQAAAGASQKVSVILKDMGKGVISSGKGFAKVGALYAGIECVIEGVRRVPTHQLKPYFFFVVSRKKRHLQLCICGIHHW